ncbi:MAG TPA: alpha/beta hydrolase [Burkholderiaceae bacterium]|nr:alpha/beta hydrolase [Burkholderiaceae bacterium]
MKKTLIAAGLVLAMAGAAGAQAQPFERLTDVAYGPEMRQRFDVYLPTRVAARPRDAAIIVMVHGGAWMIGNKALPQVIENKVAHWVAQGAIFVSINYRLVPQVTPLEQAGDVAHAVAKVQALAASWGGDADRVVLMGHSAGAHLVALVSASPAFAQRAGTRPWRGTVVLDSAALSLTALMRAPHARFYDRVFGSDPALWQAASPIDSLTPGAPPMLLVCSTRRADHSCAQSAAFAARANALGVRAQVSPQDLSHAEVNATLGLAGTETDEVDAFLASVGWRAAAQAR